jgi:hypothetical protein
MLGVVHSERPQKAVGALPIRDYRQARGVSSAPGEAERSDVEEPPLRCRSFASRDEAQIVVVPVVRTVFGDF